MVMEFIKWGTVGGLIRKRQGQIPPMIGMSFFVILIGVILVSHFFEVYHFLQFFDFLQFFFIFLRLIRFI